MLINSELVRELAVELGKQFRASIPVEIDLWSADQVGGYLKCSGRYVLEHYCTLSDFPDKIRLPSRNGGKGHPLFNAREIVAWAQKYRTHKTADFG